jgi:hypothetical protein
MVLSPFLISVMSFGENMTYYCNLPIKILYGASEIAVKENYRL